MFSQRRSRAWSLSVVRPLLRVSLRSAKTGRFPASVRVTRAHVLGAWGDGRHGNLASAPSVPRGEPLIRQGCGRFPTARCRPP